MSPVLRGAEGFERYYANVFGARWPSLRDALLGSVRHAAWRNPFAKVLDAPGGAPLHRLFAALPTALFEGCTLLDAPAAPAKDAAGLTTFYALDPASVLPPRLLAPRPGETIGELCAAPGGKALLLAERLAPDATLVLNDRSRARLERLRRVIDDYLPASLGARIRITNVHAARFGLRSPGAFDALLLDVPCSSERHVLGSPRALGEWSAARVKRLAQQQYAILAAAAAALKPGGRLVYSTCALAHDENDGVIERILQSPRHPMLSVLPDGFPRSSEARAEGGTVLPRSAVAEVEPTRFGFRILPDRSAAGPLYFAVLQKPEE